MPLFALFREDLAARYFPMTSIAAVIVFGGMQAFWSQAWNRSLASTR
jgi:hypothetical protein